VSDELTIALQSLFVVVLVAALAPLVVGLMPIRVPQVVVLIIGGVIVGPQALDLAEPASIELLSNVGLGFLFLLAGYELELALFRQRAGMLAVGAWVTSAVLAGAVVGLLAATGWVRAFVPVALANYDGARHTAADPARQQHAARVLWLLFAGWRRSG
jgi:Kef-type K+ transport system membrane component KefB